MLKEDNAASKVKSEVSSVKREIQLQTENQKTPESGHSSAKGPSGPNRSAAGQKGVGATRY